MFVFMVKLFGFRRDRLVFQRGQTPLIKTKAPPDDRRGRRAYRGSVPWAAWPERRGRRPPPPGPPPPYPPSSPSPNPPPSASGRTTRTPCPAHPIPPSP